MARKADRGGYQMGICSVCNQKLTLSVDHNCKSLKREAEKEAEKVAKKVVKHYMTNDRLKRGPPPPPSPSAGSTKTK